MIYRSVSVLLAAATITLFGTIAKADPPKEVNTEKNKAVVLGTFLSAPSNCGSNPGPIPVPKIREKPSHGIVGLQIVVADVPASDSCPARKIPAIALFYTPSADFVGNDSVQVEFETTDNKTPEQSFLIRVNSAEGKQ
jgi:hypothetical protein